MVDSMMVGGVCAGMLRLVFSKRAAVHYDQTSPVGSSCLSKGHCSRRSVVRSVAAYLFSLLMNFRKIVNCLECFPLVKNLSLCGLMDSK